MEVSSLPSGNKGVGEDIDALFTKKFTRTSFDRAIKLAAARIADRQSIDQYLYGIYCNLSSKVQERCTPLDLSYILSEVPPVYAPKIHTLVLLNLPRSHCYYDPVLLAQSATTSQSPQHQLYVLLYAKKLNLMMVPEVLTLYKQCPQKLKHNEKLADFCILAEMSCSKFDNVEKLSPKAMASILTCNDSQLWDLVGQFTSKNWKLLKSLKEGSTQFVTKQYVTQKPVDVDLLILAVKTLAPAYPFKFDKNWRIPLTVAQNYIANWLQDALLLFRGQEMLLLAIMFQARKPNAVIIQEIMHQTPFLNRASVVLLQWYYTSFMDETLLTCNDVASAVDCLEKIIKAGTTSPMIKSLARMAQRYNIENDRLEDFFGLYGFSNQYHDLPAFDGAILSQSLHSALRGPRIELYKMLKQTLSQSIDLCTVNALEDLMLTADKLATEDESTFAKHCCNFLDLCALNYIACLYIGYFSAANQAINTGYKRAATLYSSAWKIIFLELAERHPLVKLDAEKSQSDDLPRENVAAKIAFLDGFFPNNTSAADDEVLEKEVKKLEDRFGPNLLVDTSVLLPNMCSSSKTLHIETAGMDFTSLWRRSKRILQIAPPLSALGPALPLQSVIDACECSKYHYLSGVTPCPAIGPNMAVVSLNVVGANILVSRTTSHGHITVEFPIQRDSAQNLNAFSLNELLHLTTFIIRKRELIKTTDPREWWKEQRAIEKELADFLDQVENQCFGGFLGIISPVKPSSRVLDVVKSSITKVLGHNAENLDDCLIELIANTLRFKSNETSILELCSFMRTIMMARDPKLGTDAIPIQRLAQRLANINIAPNDYEDIHVVLIPEPQLAVIPWESLQVLRKASVSRCVSMNHFQRLCSLKASYPASSSDNQKEKLDENEARYGSKVFYVLNHRNNLENLENNFAASLHDRGWDGISGQKPSPEEILRHLRSSRCYVYMGHGSGHELVKPSQLRHIQRCCPIMLLGCRSAECTTLGGPAVDYAIANAPFTLGFLWSVPDKDTNRVAQELLEEHFDKGTDIFQSIRKARNAAIMSTTGAALVIYGIPD